MLHTRPVRCSGAAKLRHSAKSAAVRTHASKQPAASPAPEGPSGDAAPKFQLPMGRRGVLSGLGFGAAGSVVSCACPGCVSPAKADEWGYGDVSGPIDWGGMCAQGTTQSPVNIPLRNLGRAPAGFSIGNYLGDFQFTYGKFEPTTILNTGHGTMQVNFQPGNTARVGDKELELLQFHFHTPSEHAIDSARTPMEVHLVHRNQNTGGLAVVGILIERGSKTPNPTVRDAVKYAPLAKRKLSPCPVLIDPAQLLPPANQQGLRPFVHYQGSLTTPPCSEMVEWFVLTDPIYVSDKQVLDFMEYAGGGKDYGRNARPVQSLNSRRFDYQSIPMQLNL